MRSRIKELEREIKEGRYQLLPEYFNLKYEEVQEALVNQNDKDIIKLDQGAARLLRDLKQLTKQTISK